MFFKTCVEYIKEIICIYIFTAPVYRRDPKHVLCTGYNEKHEKPNQKESPLVIDNQQRDEAESLFSSLGKH